MTLAEAHDINNNILSVVPKATLKDLPSEGLNQKDMKRIEPFVGVVAGYGFGLVYPNIDSCIQKFPAVLNNYFPVRSALFAVRSTIFLSVVLLGR